MGKYFIGAASAKRIVSDFGNHPDNLARTVFEGRTHIFASRDALAQRVAIPPEESTGPFEIPAQTSGQRLIDQNNRRRSGVIPIRKHPSAKQRYPKDLAITPRDHT